jgi:signal peptidase II
MLNIINNRLYYILLSTIIILTDQLSKSLITVYSKSLINKNLILFRLDYVKNFGAAFNILSGNRFILSLVSILTTILLTYLIFNQKIIGNLDLFSYSFILGGTLGNGIDRLTKGYVVDFINLNFIEFPVFNIADIIIIIDKLNKLTHKINYYDILKYGILGISIMHIIGIIYNLIQSSIFKQQDILLYNISKYSLGKFGYHLLMLIPVTLLVKLLNNNYGLKR